ncbi:MAG: DUF3048 domain-containing protein [Lachnospiraceae bacterium]|nr:DUF3048 domain-containing protein [Lachnospiraceae bacterium]
MNKGQKRLVVGVLLAASSTIILIFGGAYIRKNIQENRTAQTDSQPAITEDKTAVPTPTEDPHAGMARSPMTGEWVKESVLNNRYVAVMINNIGYAFRHQMGTSKADIIYEALAEGGITRMMALYQNVSGVKQIGSVRSARHYYVQFAREWDAIFCHFGHTKYAVSKMKKLKTENLSGLSGIGPVVYARTNTLAAPHNVFTTGKKIIKGAKKLGYNVKAKGRDAAEHFSFYDEDTVPAGGKKANQITIPFSNYSTSRMKYNKKKKVYLKYEYGSKHMDTYYKKQLAFKNVLIQFVRESNIDRNGYQTMELGNVNGKGYYYTNGKEIPITWERSESANTMVYRDKSGNTLKINPGKTYIAVYPNNRKKLIRVK